LIFGISHKEGPMSYRRSRFSLLGLVAMLVGVGVMFSPVTAQDDPSIAPIELAPGVTAEVFAAAPSARASDQTVYLARFIFQPDADIFPP
jgi:hypothetical protein